MDYNSSLDSFSVSHAVYKGWGEVLLDKGVVHCTFAHTNGHEGLSRTLLSERHTLRMATTVRCHVAFTGEWCIGYGYYKKSEYSTTVTCYIGSLDAGKTYLNALHQQIRQGETVLVLIQKY